MSHLSTQQTKSVWDESSEQCYKTFFGRKSKISQKFKIFEYSVFFCINLHKNVQAMLNICTLKLIAAFSCCFSWGESIFSRCPQKSFQTFSQGRYLEFCITKTAFDSEETKEALSSIQLPLKRARLLQISFDLIWKTS